MRTWPLSIVLFGVACAPAPPRAPLVMEPIEREAAPPPEEPALEPPPPTSTEPPALRANSTKALGCRKGKPTREPLELAIGETKTVEYTKFWLGNEELVKAAPAAHGLILTGKKPGDAEVWAAGKDRGCTVFEVHVYARPIGARLTGQPTRG